MKNNSKKKSPSLTAVRTAVSPEDLKKFSTYAESIGKWVAKLAQHTGAEMDDEPEVSFHPGGSPDRGWARVRLDFWWSWGPRRGLDHRGQTVSRGSVVQTIWVEVGMEDLVRGNVVYRVSWDYGSHVVNSPEAARLAAETFARTERFCEKLSAYLGTNTVTEEGPKGTWRGLDRLDPEILGSRT